MSRSSCAISRRRRLSFPEIEAEHVTLALADASPHLEVRRLSARGVQMRNGVMTFHDRKLVFLSRPEGVTVELAQWIGAG
jgi:hypothetical protein